jgi:ketosteroid isomerase-like protein
MTNARYIRRTVVVFCLLVGHDLPENLLSNRTLRLKITDHHLRFLCLPLLSVGRPSMSLFNSEIKACFDKWTKSWNEGDINGYLQGYADLPSVRYVGGKKVVVGKENVSKLFQERGARGRLSLVHFESDCVSATDAICFGKYRLVETISEDQEENHEGCFTIHLRRIDGSWKILSDHSS